MIYGTVPRIEKPVARIVQGTVMIRSSELEESFALLDQVFELGGNTFDTAHDYRNGDCERVLGRWVRERGVREQVVIITKGAQHNVDRNRVTPFDITSDLYDSLARLQVNSIDLYLLHRDDPSVPVGPIVECLNEHLEEGRIQAFGGSNWTHDRIQEANNYAQAHGLVPFVASSPNFSLADRVKEPWLNCISISGPEGESARTWYAREQIPLFTWSSLAGGFFSGRFTRENLDSFDDYYDKVVVEAYCYDANFERLERARILADEKGVTLPQIALAYVFNQPLNIFALVGCHSGEEFRANIEAAEVHLSPQEMAWLDLRSEMR
ncbi:MAG: aldo/keto reductase [Chloroflexota bacterium]|nr:aldo/keto reductase [Chloroflexota bacterium]